MTAIAPAPVTVLGLGPMGRALAAAFLTHHHPLTVWNRTPGKAADLPERGAAVAGSIDDAVHAGGPIVACLIDYAAVRSTLGPLADSLTGRHLVNLTTGEPAQAREMARWATAHGIGYLDGALLSPTPAIGTPAATVLYSGSPDVHRAVHPTMSALGGTALHLGDDPGLAAAYDMALLDLFAASVTGVAHAFALASAEGIPPERFAGFATGISGLLGEMIPRFAQQIQADHYPGDRSTIASAASALTHIINTATPHALDTTHLTATRSLLARAIAAGHADDSLARLTSTLATTLAGSVHTEVTAP